MGHPVGPGGVFCPSVDTESLHAIIGMHIWSTVSSVLCSGLRRLWQGTEAISEPCRTHQELPFLNLVFAAVLEESLIPGSCQEKSPILRSEGQESQGK